MVGAQCHTATADPSLPWGAWVRGILGSGQLRIPTLCIYTVRSLASGSPSFYPTQPSPAAIEDLLTPVQVVPGLGPPPAPPRQASRHPHPPSTQGLWETPSSWSISGREPLPASLPPSLRACLSHLILRGPPLNREEEHRGIVHQDGALPWGLAPCPGGGPGTKLSEGGAGCPVPPSQPPWAGPDATLPSPRWDGSQWPADHHHQHHDAAARFYGLRTLLRPVWVLLWETGFLPPTSNISEVI